MGISAEVTNESRALQVLEGFLMGISSDSKINDREMEALKAWLENHIDLKDSYPFAELYELIVQAVEAKSFENSVKDELIDFCMNFESPRGPVDCFTSEMRKLHGFIHGIVADGIIKEDELLTLRRWMTVHDSNKDRWPFREIHSLITQVLADGRISRSEHSQMMKFCGNFIEEKADSHLYDDSLYLNRFMESGAPVLKTIDEIIDRDARIDIEGRNFVFTGQMRCGKRRVIEELLENLGGITRSIVNKKTDYIVIGTLSNRCWAYSTYGRKIEKAMELNFNGAHIVFLDEDELLNVLMS